MPLRNVASTFTIEQQRLEINNLAGDVNNIATGVTNVGTALTANALAAGATGADLTLSGTLTVNGTQTILNTATLEVEDKNIVIAKGATTDAAASGGGITLKGANDKTITYNQTGDKWESNKPFEASNLLYNSGNQELNGHLAINTTDATIAGNGAFVVHIDTDKNIGYSGGLSEIGNVPGIVAFHDSGALQDFGMRGITLRFAAGSAERLRITDNGLSVNANHDVRFENGTWTGEVAGKIQQNSNCLYLQGGTSGIKFRSSDGSKQLEIDSNGHFIPNSDNTFNLGSSSYRFANVYTGDLHLSNEGAGNDVDGTSGSWTMQEGADDLFLINRNTGKKYKFNLTEVS